MGTSVERRSTDLLTIDELAATAGMTVRNTRYYASLGLLPPPVKHGRIAYYDARHKARLDMVRALQEHGFTLQAVERFMADLPDDASPEELALKRAVLTSWGGGPSEPLTRRQVEERAGRKLSAADLKVLQRVGTLEQVGNRYIELHSLPVGLELLEMDIPIDGVEAAAEAISRHMDALAVELSDIHRRQVLEPFRREEHSPDEAAEFERQLARLRQLTLEAVVMGFQRAANSLIRNSLQRD